MDELDAVRCLGAHRRLDESRVAQARARLMAEIDPRTARRRRATWIVGGAIGALGAATATVVVIAVMGAHPAAPSGAHPAPHASSATPEPAPTATPSSAPVEPTVAGVLDGAAQLARTSAGSAIARGRYLRIETRIEVLELVTPGGVGAQDPYTARRLATAGWVNAKAYVTYVPRDRSGEWVKVFPPDTVILSEFGPDAADQVRAWLDGIPSEQFVVRTKGGADEDPSGPALGSDAYFAQMPREPAALLAWNRKRMAEGNSPGDASVFSILAQDLEMNVAPPDLRAAMFRALGLLTGVAVDSTVGTVTTLSFATTSPERTDTISIDTTTGLVVGTSTTLGSGGSLIPDSVPTHRTLTTLSTVDSAP